MKKVNKKRHIIRTAVVLCLLLFVLWILADNVLIHTTFTTVQIDGLPSSFSGYRIVHVSDLHNNMYGIDQSYLIAGVDAAEPDIIVITGDLVDGNTADVDNAMAFIRKAVEIAPVFYVSGNHESYIPNKFKELVSQMKDAGVTILDNENVSLFSGEEVITLAGIRDPAFNWHRKSADIADDEIKKALEGSGDNVTILLSHRPELLKTYSDNGIDLVLTGHAHGGQVRIPFIGPIYAPSQGLFPKLTSGIYTEGDTRMFVSRGMGNGIVPLRFNDGPELAVIILENGDEPG